MITKHYLLVLLGGMTTTTMILFHYFDTIINPTMIILLTILTYLSFKVSQCYRKEMRFSLGYIWLAGMFGWYCAAELIYFLQGYYGIQHFGSFEDIGYAMFYVFGIMFVLQHFNYYSIKSDLSTKILSVGVGVLLFAVYLHYSLDYESLLEFSVGTISMGLSAAFLSVMVLATITLRKSKRFHEWVLGTIAITIYTLADLSYYILENSSEFSYSDPSNYGWFASCVIFLYILLRINHKPNKGVC